MANHAPRILIAEDDAAIRSMILALLRREGFSPDAAKDGQEAIDLLAKHSYDIILLDLMMPRVDGAAVIEYLERTAPEEIPKCLVVLTAAANKDLLPIEGKPVRKLLRKPFDLQELIATVRECISESTSDRFEPESDRLQQDIM
jgi:two-component system response regulator ResD